MSLLDLLRGLLGRSKMVCVACLHAHTGTTTKAEMAAAASADANRPMSVKPVRKRACGRRSAVCRCAARSPYSCVIDPRTTKDAVAQVFSAFDAAKCGRISASDFRKALVFLGAEKHQDRAVRLLMSACAHKHTNTHTHPGVDRRFNAGCGPAPRPTMATCITMRRCATCKSLERKGLISCHAAAPNSWRD
jgi:hypothetical protein